MEDRPALEYLLWLGQFVIGAVIIRYSGRFARYYERRMRMPWSGWLIPLGRPREVWLQALTVIFGFLAMLNPILLLWVRLNSNG